MQARPTRKASEIRNTCNACGKVWHVSSGDVASEAGKSLMCFSGCLPAGFFVKELGKCPQCGSRNVTKEWVEYELQLEDRREDSGGRDAGQRVALALIRAYKRWMSPRLATRVRCRFYPTCSSYAAEAISKYGLLLGSARAARRLARCRPGKYATSIDLP